MMMVMMMMIEPLGNILKTTHWGRVTLQLDLHPKLLQL